MERVRGWGLEVTSYKLQVTSCGLQVAGYKLRRSRDASRRALVRGRNESGLYLVAACRRVGVAAYRRGGVSACRRIGVSACRRIGVSAYRRGRMAGGGGRRLGMSAVPEGHYESSPVRSAGLGVERQVRPGGTIDYRLRSLAKPHEKPSGNHFDRPLRDVSLRKTLTHPRKLSGLGYFRNVPPGLRRHAAIGNRLLV